MNKARGIYLSLFPITVVIFALFLIFVLDLVLLFLAQKEARYFTERVAESVLSLLTSYTASRSAVQNDIGSQIQSDIQSLLSDTKFSFLVLDDRTNSVSVSVKTENNDRLLEIVLGVSYPKDELMPNNARCTNESGCWLPLSLVVTNGQGSDSYAYNLANSVRVVFNGSKQAYPFTFLYHLFVDEKSLIYSKIFGSLKPRTVFNIVDVSWSTVEGPTQFSRVGRLANLPHFELSSPTGNINNGIDCSPRSNQSNNLVPKPCSFKGVGETIWNAPYYQEPFAQGFNLPGYRQAHLGLFFFREGDPGTNDYYVLNFLDDRLNFNEPNRFLNQHFKHHWAQIDQVNSRELRSAQNSYNDFENTDYLLNTPRIYKDRNAGISFGAIGEARSSVRYELFDSYILRSMWTKGSLTEIYSMRNFFWNAQCYYRRPSVCVPHNNHSSLFAYEVPKDQPVRDGNQPNIINSYVWPHFFMGSVRPEYCMNNRNQCSFDHFTPNLFTPNFSGGSGEQRLNQLPVWILNSHDGGIYRRYNDLTYPFSRPNCCLTNSSGDRLFCYEPFSATFRRQTSDNNFEQVDVQFCEGAPEMGGLLVWRGGGFSFRETESTEDVIFRRRNQGSNTEYYYWRINLGVSDSPRIANPSNSNNTTSFVSICARGWFTDNQGLWFTGCPFLRENVAFRLNSLGSQHNQVFLERVVSFFVPGPALWDWSVTRYLLLDSDSQIKLINPGTASLPANQLMTYLQNKSCTVDNKKACLLITYESLAFNGYKSETQGSNLRKVPLTVYLSKNVAFNRYMSDYQPVDVDNLQRINFSLNQNSVEIQPSGERLSFNLLVENPDWLRGDGTGRKFFDPSTQLNPSSNPISACRNFWPEPTVVSPSACPYQVGTHPKIRSALNNENIPELLRGTLNSVEDPSLMNLKDTFYNASRHFFPSFLWQDYVGPQPLSGILQGLALIHDLFRTKFRVPGDKFGLMTLINTPGYTRTFIPPTAPIFKNPSDLVFSTQLQDDQAIPTDSSISLRRLESFLAATHPSQIGGRNYWSFERVTHRYQLGLFPPIQETGETNLVWTLAVVAAYLRENAVNNQVIVPVFTDLITFGDCDMGQITGGKIKWENIYNCIRNPIRGLSGLASPTPADYNQLVNRLMYNLTGNREYVGGTAQSHQGLIRFMAENNIFPVFFVFNATAGGIPIMRQDNQCIFTRKELRQRNLPTAFNRNFDLAYGLDIGRSIWLARRSGNYGNIYAYTFGDLEPIFREVGSDFVQILPRCKPSFNESLSSTNLLTSIIARIQFLCNWYNSRNLSLNTQMAATHYSRGDNTFGPCGHSRCKPGTSTNFACHGWFFVESDMHKALSCLAFDSRAAFNSPVRYGASLFNLGLDLNMPINQTLRSVNIRPDRRVEEDFTRNFSEWNFVGRFDDFNLTFMPHIDISVAGGLRCHPTMNIEQQIEEVLRDILKKPIISLVNNFEEVGQ